MAHGIDTTWTNIRDAKKFLSNSLDADLKKQLYESSENEDTFSAYWLHLVHIIKSVSIDWFDKIRDRIKARQLSDCAAENIELLCSDYLDDWQELHGAGLCDQNLTMKMLNTIMSACGDSEKAEDFRFPLRTIKTQLNKTLLSIRPMEYDDAHKHMVKHELDVRSVLKAAKDEYRTLLDDGKMARRDPCQGLKGR